MTKFGSTTTEAPARPLGAIASSVTIGDVRFLTDGDPQTCDLTTGLCAAGIHDAWVSDTSVTSDFYAPRRPASCG